MNSNSNVYCIIEGFYNPQNFLINKDKGFSNDEIVYLRKILTINIIENLISSAESKTLEPSIFFLQQKEIYEEGLKEYFPDKLKVSCFTDKKNFFENLKKFSKYVFIYSDVMGISSKDIKNTENLISYDDNSLVISKSENNDICYIAFNKFDSNLMELILEPEINYDNLLSNIKTEKFFIQTLSGHFRVNSFSNFKLLYHRLSQKESLNYCSQEMHEKFTNLFIEYRDYIK